MRALAILALLALSACSTPAGNCALATGLALGLDVAGAWTPEQHYADAREICE